MRADRATTSTRPPALVYRPSPIHAGDIGDEFAIIRAQKLGFLNWWSSTYVNRSHPHVACQWRAQVNKHKGFGYWLTFEICEAIGGPARVKHSQGLARLIKLHSTDDAIATPEQTLCCTGQYKQLGDSLACPSITIIVTMNRKGPSYMKVNMPILEPHYWFRPLPLHHQPISSCVSYQSTRLALRSHHALF